MEPDWDSTDQPGIAISGRDVVPVRWHNRGIRYERDELIGFTGGKPHAGKVEPDGPEDRGILPGKFHIRSECEYFAARGGERHGHAGFAAANGNHGQRRDQFLQLLGDPMSRPVAVRSDRAGIYRHAILRSRHSERLGAKMSNDFKFGVTTDNRAMRKRSDDFG